jgi:Tfp pilus assembly protein PilV
MKASLARLNKIVLGSEGSVLLEVVITAVVIGVAAVGLAFMYSLGNNWVVAKGDDRIALYLAEQKIEQLRAAGFASVAAGNPTTIAAYNEDTDPATDAPVWSGPPPSGPTIFTRLTCVQFVDNVNFNLPAFPGTMAACAAGTPTNTMRITVLVTPAQEKSEPVLLQAWIRP